MATAVRYNGPHTQVSVTDTDGTRYVCGRGQQITVSDTLAASLFAEGWTAPDGSTPGYTPPISHVIEDVFLDNGVLSKQGTGGTSTPVSAGSAVDPTLVVPSTFGAAFKAAIAGGKAVVACTGDSIVRGGYSSNLDTKGWAGLLRADLQAKYGDGGSGFKSTADTAIFLQTNQGWPTNAITAATAAGLLWTVSGTWAIANPSGYPGGDNGPLNFSLFSATQNDFIQTGFRGTTLEIYWLSFAGNGSFAYSIDGGSETTVNTSIAAAVNKTTITGLSAGAHTVKIRVSSATGNVLINGIRAFNATGVVVDNFGRAGCLASNFASQSYNGGSGIPADMVLWSGGVNDAGSGNNIAPDTYIANIANWLKTVRPTTSTDPVVNNDLMFVFEHLGRITQNATPVYHAYSMRLRDLAHAYRAAWVDVWGANRNSWPYFNSLNGFSDGAGGAGNEVVHPSDAGHALYYARVKAAMQAAGVL